MKEFSYFCFDIFFVQNFIYLLFTYTSGSSPPLYHLTLSVLRAVHFFRQVGSLNSNLNYITLTLKFVRHNSQHHFHFSLLTFCFIYGASPPTSLPKSSPPLDNRPTIQPPPPEFWHSEPEERYGPLHPQVCRPLTSCLLSSARSWWQSC